MVDADHAKWRALGSGGQGDGHSGLVEGGCDFVDGDGVVGVCTEETSRLEIGMYCVGGCQLTCLRSHRK